MRIAVVYVFVPTLAYENMARRFATEYINHPPGESEHDLFVCVNGGGKVTPGQERLFDPLVPQFIYHDNSAKDLGAYFKAARTIPCDVLVCIGSPVRPRLAGWLDRMAAAVEQNGPGIYGCWAFHEPTKHIRTTMFWITPELLNAYPYAIDNSRRYWFEHSANSITSWCLRNGFCACQVTARGAFHVEQWHTPEQEDCLMLDQHCDRLGWKDEG